MIKDSGNRREFDTGAVRDIQEGKGRCDLMPLDVIARTLDDEYNEIWYIDQFKRLGIIDSLIIAIKHFSDSHMTGASQDAKICSMMLEVAKHFEQGATKYGENNWQKGIPVHCYIDSAVRHYLKYRAGWKDEPHDRAFIWNLICCIWTVQNKPELDDFTLMQGEQNDI